MSTRPRLVQMVTVPISFWLIRGHAALMSSVGFDVHAISSPGTLADEYSRDENVPVHPVPMARRIAPWSDLVSLVRLVATLKRLKPRVVQAGTPKAGLLGTIAAYFLRVPVRVYYVRGLPMLTAHGPVRFILRTTERLACAAATHVVCVSRSVRDELVTAGLCPLRKAVVIGDGSSNGVDTRCFDRTRLPAGTREQVRSRLGIPQDALVVGFIGRIGREKGICELHRAWRELRDRCPAAHLLIVGPAEAVDAVPEETQLALAGDPRVHLPGADWDTPPLYMAMDVFCLPSHREGFPNVLLEAAAMELPVVAFRIPGVVDAVEDTVTGRLVDPLNVNDLAMALDEYSRNDALRTEHGRAGRLRVTERFQREKVWAAQTEFYASLAVEHRPGFYQTHVKRTFDVLGACLALIAVAPVILLVAAMVRLQLGSPVFFIQTRPGHQGRPFRIVKFRTMRDAGDAQGLMLPDAARLTRFGAFLRSTSLDELPELWNVIRGDMSLVGPRPLLMAYLDRYTPAQARRHDALPGITGLAQVNGRNALTWDEKFALDCEYVEQCSLGLDVRILLLTIGQVAARRGVNQPGHATMEEFSGSVQR
jgi:lipopolysaccharide/colanic/teichoic acid biosynthesis glycosyltransferase